jgi:hypothetical protein
MTKMGFITAQNLQTNISPILPEIKVLFWVPTRAARLIQVLLHFERSLHIVRGSFESAAELRDHADLLNDCLADCSIRKFKHNFKPSCVRTSILRDDVCTGDELVQPLDRRSLYFLLGGWLHCDDVYFALGGGRDSKVLARMLERCYVEHVGSDARNPAYFCPDNHERMLPLLLARCRFVVDIRGIPDVDGSLVIASRDQVLLETMYRYAVSLGEPGFTYDGSAAGEAMRLRMARRDPGGLYLARFFDGFVPWGGEASRLAVVDGCSCDEGERRAWDSVARLRDASGMLGSK